MPMKYRRKASTVSKDLLNNRKYGCKYLFGEILEVFEALGKLDFVEAKMELQQVWFAIQMLYYQNTGHDFYLRGVEEQVQSFYDRRIIWLKVFAYFGAREKFNNDCLVNGSNYMRPHKIIKALEIAGVYCSPYLAETLVEMIKQKLL